MDFSSLQPTEAAVTLAVIWIGLGVSGLAIMQGILTAINVRKS